MSNKPIINAPVSREILLLSTGKAVSILATSDNTGGLYENGTLAVTLSNNGSGLFTGTYTPSTIGNKVLTFVGDVTGVSAPITVTVSGANTLNTTMTAWSQGATTTTTSTISNIRGTGTLYKVSAAASGSARRIISTTATAAGTIPQVGFEVEIAMPLDCTIPWIYVQGFGGSFWFNALTEESNSGSCFGTAVERKYDSSSGVMLKYVRVQGVPMDATTGTAGTATYIDFHSAVNESDTYTLADASKAFFYMGNPRRINDVKLPFTDSDKFSAYKDVSGTATLAATVPGAEKWLTKSPLNADQTTGSIGPGPGGQGLWLVIPSGTAPTDGWPILGFPKALSDAVETSDGNKTAYQAMTIDDYANTFKHIVFTYDEMTGGDWIGVLNDGTNNITTYLNDVLVPWLVKVKGASPKRNDHSLVSYSKGAWGIFGEAINRPDVWGNVGLQDAPWINGNPASTTTSPGYPNNNSGISFSDSVHYYAKDALTILNSTTALPFKDGKRIAFGWAHVWLLDQTTLKNKLDALGIPYYYNGTDSGIHAWQPTGTGMSATRDLVNAMMANRALIKAARPATTFFFSG